LIPALYSVSYWKLKKSGLAEQILEANRDSRFITSGIAVNETLYVDVYDITSREE